jgi:polar amino acid transport system substrate-binding protein
MLLASAWGLVLALARTEGRLWGRLATIYIELVRGTPILLQLYLLYFGLAPFVSLSPWTAAVLGLGLNYAAYEAEIYRGAIQAVPRGQWEAASALGMSRPLTYRRIILPQALRVALPGMVNDFISLLKDSSLVSVLTVVELTKRMTIVAVDNRGWLVPGLLCAALYWTLGYPFARLARRWENRWVAFRPGSLD